MIKKNKSMLVARLVAPRLFQLYDENIPSISEHEALLRIKSVGICGSDLHRFRGHTYGDGSNEGIVLGHEFSAVVEHVGAHVSNVKVGDRVAVEAAFHCGACEWCLKGYTNLCPHVKFCGLPGVEGALREYRAWPAHLLFKLPDSLDFDDGALAEGLGICLHALDLANMRAGFTAAVLGCGPIGLGMIELLRKVAGAGEIFATELVPERLAFAKTFGADVVLNDDKENIVEKMLSATGGRGVDVVFEAAGVEETLHQMVEIAAPGGKVVIIGIPESEQIAFAASPARRKGLTFRFVRRSLNTYSRVLRLMDNGIINVKKMVTHHFPLNKVQRGFDVVDAYQDGAIKVMITC